VKGFYIIFVSVGLLCSCASRNLVETGAPKTVRATRSDRDRLAAIYKDKRRSLRERQAAFDALLETFTPGTQGDVIRDYIEGETVTSRIVPPEDGDVRVISFDAPDGSSRWITVVDDKVKY
jgi:hypothetical protein